jgi:meso-butanediol dehydrogenase/(S,S)-butanediol dehydrogenase/diacetyl reductase
MTKRTVLVTGGARGIGKGIARAFLLANHKVMIADLGADAGGSSTWNYNLASTSAMRETVEELTEFGEIACVALDVTNKLSCDNAVAVTCETFGGLDVLANNAGIVASGPIEDFSEADWDSIFDVNVKGIYNMTRAALGALKTSSNAAIVNTASIAGKKGSANLAAYCASKFAVVGLTQSLALEFAPHGIRVNALCPGIVGTAMWLDHLMANQGEAAFEERMHQLVPMGRPQTEQDMGEAAVYLASSPNVTGVSLAVAGGLEMN